MNRTITKMRLRSVIMPLILANIVMFIIQISIKGFTESFMLVSADVYSRPWILLTSMFMHSPLNLSHILFNMYGLFLFGPILESRIGPKRFLLVYMVSGIIAGYLASFFYDAALGASGAIMGMLGTLIILMPDLKLLLFFIIPMPLKYAGLFWALFDTIGLFYPTGIGSAAHLAGLGLGLLYGLYLKGKRRNIHRRPHMGDLDIDEYLRNGRL